MDTYTQTILRENNVTIGGNDGWKIEFTDSNEVIDSYGFDILTFINGKLYTLSYNEESLEVPETVPLSNKMVESFRITE